MTTETKPLTLEDFKTNPQNALRQWFRAFVPEDLNDDGEFDENFGQLIDDNFWLSDGEKHIKSCPQYKDIEVSLVYSFGGEGKGDHVEFVLKISTPSKSEECVYLQVNGYYDSYNGTEWDGDDDIVVVEPYEFKEIRYKKAK